MEKLKKNANNGAERKRKPLSDCTNSLPTIPNRSSSSSAFNKSVTRCVLFSGRNTSDERKNKKNVALNSASDTIIPQISNIRENSGGVENLDLPKIKPVTVPGKKKQRAGSKEAQLQDFIEKQRAYFKELDEFKLLEEEVKSIYELD